MLSPSIPSRTRTIGGLGAGAGAAAKLGATNPAVMSAAATVSIDFLATDDIYRDYDGGRYRA